MKQISLKQLTDTVLPAAQSLHSPQDDEALKAAVKSMIGDETQILGEDGKTVLSLDDIDLKLVDDDGTGTTEPAPKAAQTIDAKEIASLVKASVADALKDFKPNRSKAVAVANTTRSNHVVSAPAKKRFGTLKAFSNDEKGEESAYRLGCWAMAIRGHQSATAYCMDHGIDLKFLAEDGSILTKVASEGVNTAGGYLVPEEFSANLIRLVLQYGVFRRNARTVPMIRDIIRFPRRVSGLTAYWVGENAAGTESQNVFDDVVLSAKKLMNLTRWSNELGADAAISIGDLVATESALSFANKEDEAGFNGDGTSTYGGIVGIRQRLVDINGTDDGGGIVTASGNLWSEITLGDLHKAMGRVAQFAGLSPKWYVSKPFHEQVMQTLAASAGGNTVIEITDLGPRFMWGGYPVELTEVMPKTQADTTICAIFGDLSMSSSFGDRQQSTVAFSEHATIGGESMFERDQVGVRYTERLDINNHDLGDATNAGPVVGLQTIT